MSMRYLLSIAASMLLYIYLKWLFDALFCVSHCLRAPYSNDCADNRRVIDHFNGADSDKASASATSALPSLGPLP